MASSLRLVVSRHKRDSATASKLLVFVSINQFERVDYTDGRIALQTIHGIKSGLALDVDKVSKVPTHEVVKPGDRAGRDMTGVIAIFHGQNSVGDITSGKLLYFIRYRHQSVSRKSGLKKRADFFWSFGQFVKGNG